MTQRIHIGQVVPGLTKRIRDFIREFTISLSIGPSLPSIVVQLRRPFVTRRFPWRGKRRMLAALGPVLGAEVIWAACEGLPPSGEIAAIFDSTSNINKALHYLPVYESALSSFRSRPIRMLEIGVDRGGSMQMWRRYLHPESIIVGIDINPAALQYDDPSRDMHVRVGDQQDTSFLEEVVTELGPFDVILDDGSHMTSHMVQAFRYLFPRGLASGGLYMVEDIGTNYQKPWRDSSMTFVDFTKWLTDAMHAHYQVTERPDLNFRVGGSHRLTELSVPLATTLIEKVEFYDSIALIHRAKGCREMPRGVYK